MVAKQYGKNKDGGNESSMKPFMFVLGGAAVIAIGAVVWSNMSATLSGAATIASVVEYDDVNDLVAMATGVERGNPDAEIVIMEFADFQCPACQAFATQTKPQVDLAYIETGEVRFVMHDFPLVQHPHAFLAARAARCALDQGDGNYWPYHDILFQNQREWSPSAGPPLRMFQGYAEELGLDAGEFSGCLNSDRHAQTVSANMELGRLLGVGSTPTIFMSREGAEGGTMVSDWNSFAAYQELIEQYQAEIAAEGGETSESAESTGGGA